MEEWEKNNIDIEYIIERDTIIKYLLDYKRTYTIYDSNKIKKILKQLIKILERGQEE